MKTYIAYIDEAGDEGFGKLRVVNERGGQSTWLMLGAIIVSEDYDAHLPKIRDAIRAFFPEKKERHLHWVNFNHDQRIVVADEMAKLRLGVCLTLSHKVTIPDTKFATIFSQPQYLYNYLVRWLLERLITAAEQAAAPEPAQLKLVFSKKGGTNYQIMAEYLTKLARGQDLVKAPRRTNWEVLDIKGMRVENHSKMAGLQLADCATSAFFRALEPNRFGNYEPAYATRLIPKLIKSNGRVDNAGLTVVPSTRAAKCDEEQMNFLRECWAR
tara:strand:- start:701 stop:1510 length:810 start_codon:yes stop_codon:yes gene_type:complete